MNKDAHVIKALAEIGIDVTPKEKENSPNIEEVKARLADFEKEVGAKLDPETLSKYLALG
jgi:hypothetical protein